MLDYIVQLWFYAMLCCIEIYFGSHVHFEHGHEIVQSVQYVSVCVYVRGFTPLYQNQTHPEFTTTYSIVRANII